MRIETGGVDQYIQPDLRAVPHNYPVRNNASDLSF
jgi:hypothetical protein